MWENTAEPGRPRMTMWRMRIACWVPKSTNAHSEFIALIALLLHQLLHERSSVLRCMYIVLFFVTTTRNIPVKCVDRMGSV
jgi:hypothetical protein